MDNLNVGNLSSLVSLLALIITWMVIQPLKQSITTLTRSMEKLTSVMEATRAEVNEIRERLAKVESSASSAHKRLDDFIK